MITLYESATKIIVTGEPHELDALIESIRFRPLNYEYVDSYVLFQTTEGTSGWDGYRYPLVRKTRTAAEILRGRREDVIATCRDQKLKVDLSKLFVSPFVNLKVEDLPDDLVVASFHLDARQKRAVVEWLRHGIGILHASVNAGKTVTFAAAAAMVKRKYPDARFLYFTPSERLVQQAVKDLRGFLPTWDISQYGGGGKRNKDGKDMVVCTTAILARNFTQLSRENWLKTFECLLMDECHHHSSPSSLLIMNACDAPFRFGASDSLKQADPDKHHQIVGLCGPVRSRITAGELVRDGRSAKPHVYVVDVPEWRYKFSQIPRTAERLSPAWVAIDGVWQKATYLGPLYQLDRHGEPVMKAVRKVEEDGFRYVKEPVTIDGFHRLRLSSDGSAYTATASQTSLLRRYDRAVIRFKERNDLIVKWAKHYAVANKWQTLVVATRTTHVLILEALLKAELDPDSVRALWSEHTSKQRDDCLEWLRQTPGSVLVSPLVKEGVSINQIQAVVVADRIVDFEVVSQIIGRAMRKKEALNECHSTLFIERQVRAYEIKSMEMLGNLEQQRDCYHFHHPVTTPDSVTGADTSTPENKMDLAFTKLAQDQTQFKF